MRLHRLSHAPTFAVAVVLVLCTWEQVWPRPSGSAAAPAEHGAPNGDTGNRRARDRLNLFANGDFEAGRAPWFDLASPSKTYWHGFELSQRFAWRGRSSALLSLEARATEARYETTSISGLVQEVGPGPGQTAGQLPETISGYFRVENWTRRLPKQYLQFVVILWGSDLHPEVPNLQLRYVLGGLTEPPFDIGNARYLFLGPGEPKTGMWVRFERNLRKDWAAQWGGLPHRYDKIRCLFEVRFDGRSGPAAGRLADVYFDDLYLGPALPAP